MIGVMKLLGWGGKLFGFFGTREGKIVLALLAFTAWTQYQRLDAANEAEAKLTIAIEEARAEAQAEWQAVVDSANQSASNAALVAAAEIEELKELVNEIENDPASDACTISGDLLERLRAIR